MIRLQHAVAHARLLNAELGIKLSSFTAPMRERAAGRMTGRWLPATAALTSLTATLLAVSVGALMSPYWNAAPTVIVQLDRPSLDSGEIVRLPIEAPRLEEMAALDAQESADAPASDGDDLITASITDQQNGTLGGSTQFGEMLPSGDLEPFQTTVAVSSGDTLMELLTGAGADRGDAHHAISAMRPIYDPRKLRVGQEIELTFEPVATVDTQTGETGEAALHLVSLNMNADFDRAVTIRRDEDGNYAGEEIVKDLTEGLARAKGTIDSSLFLTAQNAGVPVSIIAEMIRMYSYSIDFQRDIQPGDHFEVLFTRKFDEDGKPVREGDVLFADLTVGGKSQKLWRYTPKDGPWDYFDETGQSMKKFLMKTPIDGARLSSSFGMRKHPVLGYSKLHSGVDFAAPRGTPIYAAGNGVVTRANRFSTYGNYISIRHGNGYETAYAHLNGFARGIKAGARVRQGQVIGYVGTTGRSTGPHLHYEIHVGGKKVNPMKIKVPTGQKLASADLKAFNAARAQINAQIASAPMLTRVETAKLSTPQGETE